MYSEDFVRTAIKEQGILPLFYHDDPDTCIAIAQTLYEAGVRCIEFTNRGEKPFQNFEALVKQRDSGMPGLLLGAGAIVAAQEANSFIQAGADFLVSPVFDASVCDAAYIAKVLWIPGCMTPTEIHVAKMAGCNIVKLFPGNLLKPSFLEAIRPLFREIDFVITGGVNTTEEKMNSWFKAGAAVLGMGSKLISKQVMEQRNFGQLKTDTLQVFKTIKFIRDK